MAGSSIGAFMGSSFFGGGSNGDRMHTPSQSPSFLASNMADQRTPLTTLNSSFTGIHQKLDSLLGHTASNRRHRGSHSRERILEGAVEQSDS